MASMVALNYVRKVPSHASVVVGWRTVATPMNQMRKDDTLIHGRRRSDRLAVRVWVGVDRTACQAEQETHRKSVPLSRRPCLINVERLSSDVSCPSQGVNMAQVLTIHDMLHCMDCLSELSVRSFVYPKCVCLMACLCPPNVLRMRVCTCRSRSESAMVTKTAGILGSSWVAVGIEPSAPMVMYTSHAQHICTDNRGVG